MSGIFGMNIKMAIYGESHGKSIGVVLDGLPPGLALDEAAIAAEMARRAPGQNALSTARKESDTVEIQSGFFNGFTTGTPLCARIVNSDQHSKDYSILADKMRPGHADYAGHVRYQGFNDYRGGGHFSGRLTAPLCIAGGICLQLLENEGVSIRARVNEIGGAHDEKEMHDKIMQAKAEGDSVGGVIECVAEGVPAGLGGALFGGMESRISAAVFGIPAVKGIEFGAGFASARLRGSENNDEFCINGGRIETRGNNCGGILGGITDGMPLVFRAAVKPTPSIAKPQRSVDLRTLEETTIEIHGRHDACIVPRAVPCVEAAAAIAIYDAWLARRGETEWT